MAVFADKIIYIQIQNIVLVTGSMILIVDSSDSSRKLLFQIVWFIGKKTVCFGLAFQNEICMNLRTFIHSLEMKKYLVDHVNYCPAMMFKSAVYRLIINTSSIRRWTVYIVIRHYSIVVGIRWNFIVCCHACLQYRARKPTHP